MFKNSLTLSRMFLSNVIKAGDTVIDATCGRGKDTLFLAQLVGSRGKVYAFDIQIEAINDTRRLLSEHDRLDIVTLISDNHAEMGKYISGENIRACVFNLGYLPAGNQSIVTKPDSTVKAIEQVLPLLVSGGIISLVIYTGHPGGKEEYTVLKNYLAGISQQEYEVLELRFINQINHPPGLIIIQKI